MGGVCRNGADADVDPPTSELLDVDELAAVLAEADRLPPASLTLDGRRWR